MVAMAEPLRRIFLLAGFLAIALAAPAAAQDITFDADKVMYVANFNTDANSGVEEAGPYGVTIIKNGDGNTAKLMTLPTGGEEVTLANGFPLYGNAKGEISYHCYDPLMRMTASRIDRAGNLWAWRVAPSACSRPPAYRRSSWPNHTP